MQPHNPVPIPRESAGEMAFQVFFDGAYSPMIKQPKKLAGKSTKIAV